MILFIGFWLIGWAIGEIVVTGMLIGGLFAAFNGGIGDLLSSGAGAFGGLFMLDS